MTENNSSRPSSQPADPGRPPRGAAFFGQIRRQGFVRSADDRWLGGVCRSIADRTGYDVTLVRGVTFVLTLFFGFGILLYGLAWAFLPEPDGRIHAQEVLHGRWSAGLVGAGIFTLMGLGNPGFHGPLWLFWPWGDWSFWGWFGPLLGVGLIVWIAYAVVTNKRKAQFGPGRPPGGPQGPRGFGPAGPRGFGPQGPGGSGGFGGGDPQGPAGFPVPGAPAGEFPASDSPAGDPASPEGGGSSAPAESSADVDGAPIAGDAPHSFGSPTSSAFVAPDPVAPSSAEPGTTPDASALGSTMPAPGYRVQSGVHQGSSYQQQDGYQQQSFADVPRYAGSYRGGPAASAPARRPAPPAPRRTRARSAGAPILLLFSGLALLALVGVWVLDRSMELPGHPALIAIGGAIFMLGLGILVSGFRGRRGGALSFWAWVGIAAALVAMLVTGVGQVTAVKDATWTPSSDVVAEQGYSVGVGATTVDLRGLNPQTRIDVPVNSGIGDVHLLLPPGVPAEVRFSGGVRDGERPGADGASFDDSNFLVNNTKQYGTGDPLIVVTVRIGVGDLTVDGVEQGANR